MQKQQDIFLYGAPASGKSTLAKALGKALNLPVIDLDEQIVQRLQMPISEFFQAQEEGAFRDMETKTLTEILQEPS